MRYVGDALIRIKDLRLRTYIGFNPEEQAKKQDVVINMAIHYDAARAAEKDAVGEALNYKTTTKKVIALVEENQFLLLEKLVHDILELALEHPSIRCATVEVDKPHALRFADSVSLSMSAERDI
ncbi:MAG: dihydroneopterin triphosphate 2'-epimerase [Pseudomonadota bacterium]